MVNALIAAVFTAIDFILEAIKPVFGAIGGGALRPSALAFGGGEMAFEAGEVSGLPGKSGGRGGDRDE